MTRALVTGCAGFIGSHLTDRLLELGHEVMGVDSFEDYYPRSFKESNLESARTSDCFTLIEANILDLAGERRSDDAPSELQRIVQDVDYVFHLAAQAGVRASWGHSFGIYTDNNILATQLLLEACRDASIEKFVYASSSSVYGDTDVIPMQEDAVCRPFSPYGVSKLAGEHLAQLYWRNWGTPAVSLRFFTVYGPRQRPDMAFHRFIRAILAGQPIQVFGDGEQTRDFTYVSDIVAGLCSAMEAPEGLVANLAGGSRVSLLEAIDVLAEVSGQTVQIEHAERHAGDVRDTYASIERAQTVLGYQPRVTLKEGLKTELEWLVAIAEVAGPA